MTAPAQPLIERVLIQLGFRVESIPEVTGVERADYRVCDSANTYLIEAKRKSDAESVLQEYRGALSAGDVFLRSEPEGYKNAYSNVLDKAASQLESTAESEAEFQLVWFELVGLDRELQFRQAVSTIYGIVRLIPCLPGRPVARDCFYFKHNVAYRQPNIDAFFVSDGHTVTLALNAFSNRRAAFLKSHLYCQFAERKGVSDPIAMEESGNIYVADCPTPRSDKTAVLEYLQSKYGIDRFIDVEFTDTTATVEVRPTATAT